MATDACTNVIYTTKQTRTHIEIRRSVYFPEAALFTNISFNNTTQGYCELIQHFVFQQLCF